MSDHISGPRALADPIADITDVYAFPSPERPGHLVLVMNTLPFAKPSDLLSDGLVYRFRLRPLTAGAPGDPAPFAARDGGARLRLRLLAPAADDGAARRAGRHLHHAGGRDGPVPGERRRWRLRARRPRLRRPALGPVHHGRPRGAEDDRDRRSWRSPIPGSIYLDGKNVLSLVVEIDTALLGGASLVGVVAETLTRGKFNVRIERVGRPEVKNMMLAPKQFDQVNRDLEIRDLYNMEDAFHLADGYLGAYRARLNANLAFWDGLDGKIDWPTDGNGGHPLTELVLADFLVVDVTKPYVEQGSFLEIELAARRGEAHATCGGRTLNDDVMDTIFTQLDQRRERARHPRRRRPGRRDPPRARFPYLSPPNPDPPEPPEHH